MPKPHQTHKIRHGITVPASNDSLLDACSVMHCSTPAEIASNTTVHEGALNSALEFLAAMPPNTVRGNVMRDHRKMMMTMVPKGRAAVDCTRKTACKQKIKDKEARRRYQ
eukprot:1143089-Pelagomonas_calceolata.AAC.14